MRFKCATKLLSSSSDTKEWQDKLGICILQYRSEPPKSTRIGVRSTNIQSWTDESILGSCGQLQAHSFNLTKLWTPILHSYCQSVDKEKQKETRIPPVRRAAKSSSVCSTKQAWFWNAKLSETMKGGEKARSNVETVSLSTTLVVVSSSLLCRFHNMSNLQDLSSSLACAYGALCCCLTLQQVLPCLQEQRQVFPVHCNSEK